MTRKRCFTSRPQAAPRRLSASHPDRSAPGKPNACHVSRPAEKPYRARPLLSMPGSPTLPQHSRAPPLSPGTPSRAQPTAHPLLRPRNTRFARARTSLGQRAPATRCPSTPWTAGPRHSTPSRASPHGGVPAPRNAPSPRSSIPRRAGFAR